MQSLRSPAGAGLVVLMLADPVAAQTAPAQPTTETFASENAILDTSILFAIGAREAQQELRGAFGWPTFQEGLVEGVYFRFDPDGYARFAPTPRLDTDVFEVICRPRTLSCMGRKQSMSVILNAQGQLQIKLDEVAQGDTFFVDDGVTELQVPDRILMPLETRLETLLSAGGELVVRRGESELARISLAGFSAVASYLRWIVARQDYTVLPRGWPVPNSTVGGDQSGLTQSATWLSPMPQPQMQPILAADEASGQATGVQTQVAEVRGELNILRELLLERSGQGTGVSAETVAPAPSAQVTLPQTSRIDDLERAALDIRREIEALRSGGIPADPQGGDLYAEGSSALPSVATDASPANGAAIAPSQVPLGASAFPAGNSDVPILGAAFPTAEALPQTQRSAPADLVTGASGQDPVRLAQRLTYLITEIGLDPKTAVMLLDLSASDTTASPPSAAGQVGDLYQDHVVTDILKDLAPAVGEVALQAPPTPVPPQQVDPGEYQLLSSYFRSVFDPSLALESQVPTSPKPNFASDAPNVAARQLSTPGATSVGHASAASGSLITQGVLPGG